MAVQPAGFLASRSRTGWPCRIVRANRPSTSSSADSRANAIDGVSGGRCPGPPSAGSAINGAAMATIAALARLNWPGSPMSTGQRSPSAVTSVRSLEPGAQRRAGEVAPVARPLPSLAEVDPAPARRAADGVVAPHLAGPHPADVRCGGGGPHHHRIVGVGHHHGARPAPGGPRRAAPPSAARHRSTSIRTSEILSSWSRDRLRRTTTRGDVSAMSRPRYPSSTSSTASAPGGEPARAATWPAGMLAPVSLVATGTCPVRRPGRPPASGSSWSCRWSR